MKIFVSKLRFFLLFFIFTHISGLIFAQAPIKIMVNATPPYPNYADEIIEMGDQVLITLQNTDLFNSHSIRLSVTMDGNNGVIIKSKPDIIPSQPIEIPAGETILMTGLELSNYYNNFTESDFEFIGISKTDLINDQQLPDGMYTICLRAFNFHSGIPLSDASPSGCSAPFLVLAADPPIITYPQNNSVVPSSDPQLLNINWMPVNVALADLRYRLEIIDLTNISINLHDAFQTPAYISYQEDDLISNVFLYGMEHPILELGHKYAIRVKAYRDGGNLNISNSGYSDVVVFTYGQISSEPDGDDDPIINSNDVPVEIEGDVQDQDLACGSNCHYNLQPNNIPKTSALRVGDIVDIGQYQLKITSISGSGTYSGSGIIQPTGYIYIPIKVSFKDLKVNENNRVYEGSAAADVRSESWIDQTWSDIKTQAKSININPARYKSISSFANDYQNHISSLKDAAQSVGTTLPFSIGTSNHTLQVVGMNFFPTRASFNLSYILKLADDNKGERYLHFMGKDFCITPGGPGLSAEEAKLELMKTIRFNFDNSTFLSFKTSDSNSKGTYVTFDCSGFNGVHATGEVIFDNQKLKPVDENGDVVLGDSLRASFSTSFTTWSDWMAHIHFDATQGSSSSSSGMFMYSELGDYLVKIENAYIDKSVNRNIEGMTFPENYSKHLGSDWQGVYIQTLRVELPRWVKSNDEKEKRIQIEASDMIIDGDGVTGVIHARNVINRKNGSMGKWPISIDSVMIKLTDSRLDHAYLKGDLIIPLIDEGFAYTADLQFIDHQTKHHFTFQPLDSYSFSAWYAQAILEENSSLAVEIENGHPYIEANLHGRISFAGVIGGIDKMNLTDITFEGMKVRSEKKPTYVEIGNIGTGLSATHLAIAGFGILLDKVGWMEDAAGKAGLTLGVGMDLAGGIANISGKTELLIKNKIEEYTDSLAFNRDGTDIKNIYVSASTSAVKIEGEISFFKEDPKFGNGFEGSLNLAFLETITLKGNVMFGNVKEGDTEKATTYWYAHAMAYLPSTPLPMATPVDIYGFGGGVYYNMSLNKEFPKPGAVGGGDLSIRDAFNVEKGMLGLQASVVLGLTPSSQTFNADVTLTAEINRNTGGLNMIAFTGTGYLMQKLGETDTTSAMVTAQVAISYDFPQKTFQANFGVRASVPKAVPLLNVSGDINFYRSPELWYLKAGVPTKPMTGTIKTGFTTTAKVYFMTGEQLPPPVLPTEVSSFFNFNSSLTNNTQNGMGVGFMGGLHLAINQNFTLWGTGLQMRAMAGADLAVLDYFAATCNGNENFGINKWYAQGRAYLFGEISVDFMNIEMARASIGAMVEAAFPNPAGVKGILRAEIQLLGIIDAGSETTFKIGSFCNIQPMEDADEKIDRKEKELDNIKMIGLIEPANGEMSVSTNTRPTIQWYYNNYEPKRFVYGDGLGGIIDLMFRIRNESKWEIKENNQWNKIKYRESFDESTKISTLTAINDENHSSLLHGLKEYRITATSYIERRDMSTGSTKWVPATYTEGENKGQPIIEMAIHQFKTQTNLTEIDQFFVDYTLPYPKQRYYPYGYLNKGKIKFNVDHEPKFRDFEDCGYSFFAEFDPLDGTGSLERQVVERPNLLEVRFNMSELSPETIYKLQIVAERKTTKSAMQANTQCSVGNPQDASSWLSSYGITKPNYSAAYLGNFNLPSGFYNLRYGDLLNPGAVQGAGTSNKNNAQKPASAAPAIPEDTITQRNILYTIYFRTSKYETPQQKLNSISATGVTVTIETQGNKQNRTQIKEAVIHIDAGEGFDRYDLLGHEYRTNETMEYFRAYGPTGRQSDITDASVKNWFFETLHELYRFGSYGTSGGGGMHNAPSNDPRVQAARAKQEAADAQRQLWQVDFKADGNNYMGIKGLDPLLSDVELGLAPPEPLGFYMPFVMPVYMTPTASSQTGNSPTTTSNLNVGGYNSGVASSFTGANNYGLGIVNTGLLSGVIFTTPTQQDEGGIEIIEVGTKGILELEYPLGRTAYEMSRFLIDNGYPISREYKHKPPVIGSYPIRIDLSNTNYDANSGDPNQQSKTLNVNIPF